MEVGAASGSWRSGGSTARKTMSGEVMIMTWSTGRRRCGTATRRRRPGGGTTNENAAGAREETEIWIDGGVMIIWAKTTADDPTTVASNDETTGNTNAIGIGTDTIGEIARGIGTEIAEHTRPTDEAMGRADRKSRSQIPLTLSRSIPANLHVRIQYHQL